MTKKAKRHPKHPFGVRLSPEDLARVEQLHKKLPALKRAFIVKQTVRLGLDAAEADPSKVVTRGEKATA